MESCFYNDHQLDGGKMVQYSESKYADSIIVIYLVKVIRHTMMQLQRHLLSLNLQTVDHSEPPDFPFFDSCFLFPS